MHLFDNIQSELDDRNFTYISLIIFVPTGILKHCVFFFQDKDANLGLKEWLLRVMEMLLD